MYAWLNPVHLFPLSRSFGGQGHLVNRALLFHGLDAATAVIGSAMYIWLNRLPNDIFPLSRSFGGQGHCRSRLTSGSRAQQYMFDSIRDLVTFSQCEGHMEVKVIPRSRSSKVKVIWSHYKLNVVYRSLLDTALFLDGLDATTSVIGISNVYLTQWVTKWPPTVKVILELTIIGGEGHFRIKVIRRSSSKVLRSSKVNWLNQGHLEVKVI